MSHAVVSADPSRDFQDRSETLGRAGKTWPDIRLESAEQAMRWTYGWQWACPDDSPLKRLAKLHSLNDENEETAPPGKAFVGDFYKSTDVCYNPEIRNLHSQALVDHRFANTNPAPCLSVCRTLRNIDIVGMPLDAVYRGYYTFAADNQRRSRSSSGAAKSSIKQYGVALRPASRTTRRRHGGRVSASVCTTLPTTSLTARLPSS